MLQAEAGYKVTADEVEEDKERRGISRESFLLDRDRQYWRRFIQGDGLDKQAVIAAKYGVEQVDWIESELIRRRWIPDSQNA